MLSDLEKYFLSVADSQEMHFAELRKHVRSFLPEATEEIWYGMPTLKINGKAVVSYAAFKEHVSIFPLSPEVISLLKNELEGYTTSKGTIRFTQSMPVSKELVEKIITLRMAEVAAGRKMRRK